MTDVYISIGNSDDKLSQADWHLFFSHVRILVEQHAEQVYGVWHSLPDAPFQNGCFGFKAADAAKREFIRMRLGELAQQFRQDWIAWVEGETQAVKP